MRGVGDMDWEVMGSAQMSSGDMGSEVTCSEGMGSAQMSSGGMDSEVMGSAKVGSGT
jgi:hypothetical protein